MQAVTVIINGAEYQLTQPLPDVITDIGITCIPGANVQAQHALAVKKWLNEIIDKLTCEYLCFNQVLIPVSELKKLKI